MAEQSIYLELTDAGSNAHRFYQVMLAEHTLTIRFGRLHTQGTTRVKTYATVAQAQEEAQKKIREKQRKGYQIVPTPSIPPEPKVNHELSFSSRSSEIAVSLAIPPSPASIRWQFDSGFAAFGIAVDEHHCWLGNEKGQVFKLDHQGQILQKYQLPDAVKCIVVDDIWLYVGCDNGNIYDLSGKFPYLAYELERNLDILWLDIYDGVLGVSDAQGGLSKIDPEGEILWNRLGQGQLGWMLCCDAQGFYHGHAKGVTMYELETGRQLWHQGTLGKVLFGCQQGDHLFVATSGKVMQSFHKTGKLLKTYSCEASVYCCTTDDTGNYLYLADSSAFIYCFTVTGDRLWKVSTGCGSALSIQYFDRALYFVTNQGLMVCWDLQAKSATAPQEIFTPAPHFPSQGLVNLETTTQTSPGVILECFRQGNQLRVHPLSDGYHRHWMVQFPRDLRREGDRYWVQELREAKQGSYYRIYGEIKRLTFEGFGEP